MQEMYEGDTEMSANITYQNICSREIEVFMETLQEKIRGYIWSRFQYCCFIAR